MSKPSMERPPGPRPPQTNDRNKAFESIFGRPSAVHHLVPPQQQYPRYSPAGPSGGVPSPSVVPHPDSRQPYPYAQNYTQPFAPPRAQTALGSMGDPSPQYGANTFSVDPRMYTQYSQAS